MRRHPHDGLDLRLGHAFGNCRESLSQRLILLEHALHWIHASLRRRRGRGHVSRVTPGDDHDTNDEYVALHSFEANDQLDLRFRPCEARFET